MEKIFSIRTEPAKNMNTKAAGKPVTSGIMFFAGSVLIEKIFSIDGLGLLSYTALVERDYPLLISNMFIFTVLGLMVKLWSDLMYVVVDPRISFEGSKA